MTSIGPKGEMTDKPLKQLSPDDIKVLVHESSRGLSLVRTAYFDAGKDFSDEQRKMILQIAEADQLAEIHTDYILDCLKKSITKLYPNYSIFSISAQLIRELNNVLTLADIPPNKASLEQIYELFNPENTTQAQKELESLRKTILSELSHTFLSIKSPDRLKGLLKSTLNQMTPIRLSLTENKWGLVRSHELWEENPGYVPVFIMDKPKPVNELIKYDDAARMNCDYIAAELKKNGLQPFRKYM